MEPLKSLVDGNRVTCWCLCWVVALVLIFQPAVTTAAQVGYEAPATLSASQILPPELLSGPNHRRADSRRVGRFLEERPDCAARRQTRPYLW